MRTQQRRVNGVIVVTLALLLVCSLIPVWMMLSMSLKPTVLIYGDYWRLPFPPYFANYSVALVALLAPAARTLAVAAAAILGITATSCVAAYVFARLRFLGKESLFFLVVLVLVVPGVLTLTPSFVLADRLGLRNSLIGLTLFYIGGGQVFAIFLLRSFFQSQPEELFEAARLDGASELRIIWSIAVPLARPILVTLAIMNFLAIYNDLVWPLLMLPSPDKHTLTIALQQFTPPNPQLPSRPDLGVITAGYVVASLPILGVFLFGMRYYIEGLTSGSVKV
jgi:ABC-type glycerol-3-phosphate transport system permease component